MVLIEQPTLLNLTVKKQRAKTLRNTLVPPIFVQVGDKTFGEVTASKLVNYGTEWSGINLADAQDAYFNKERPKQNLRKLKGIGSPRRDFPNPFGCPCWIRRIKMRFLV